VQQPPAKRNGELFEGFRVSVPDPLSQLDLAGLIELGHRSDADANERPK
jgi:hypothetical protein